MKENLACLHTHTNFCDGHGEVEDFCRAAWEKGLSGLGFSAHAPIRERTGIASGWHLPEERWGAYREAVEAAKRRWAGRLPVYLGLEVDFIAGAVGPADREFQSLGLDFIIGSVHYVVPPRGAPFAVDDAPENFSRGLREGFGNDGAALLTAYWDAVEGLIRAGGFDILGHADLIRKNNLGAGAFFSEDDLLYRRRMAEAAAAAGHKKVIAEVNTGGMNRRGLPSPYPAPPLLRLFRENGVEVVVNADAHRPEELDGHYADAREELRTAGYEETLLFDGAGWRRVSLEGAVPPPPG